MNFIPDWGDAVQGDNEFDQIDFHIDLGCGKRKKGRIGLDHYAAPGVDYVVNLDDPNVRLPFSDSSMESAITHHCLEHIVHLNPLMDEVYRVLMPEAIFRIIVPLFPSWSAVADPDHKRYFMAHGEHCTFDAYCGTPGNCWLESFSVPYTKARFEKVHQDITPPPEDPALYWTPEDAREMRIALKAKK